MVDFMDSMLKQEHPEGELESIAQQWKQKMNTPTFKYWAKKEDGPFVTMRMEIKYPKKFDIMKVADVMFDVEHKLAWDKNVEL